MKLAKKALLLTLAMLTLIAMVSAQKSENDPRNTAPTVGTGGPVGGPTGLFTVYDGHTLQKGEYTFSAAYSNYDRDPGDVDITEVPLSFQFGLTNRFEIFFNTDAYRAVKVNSPRNLSGFYLPNSGGSLPAIVLAPGTGAFANRSIFRPGGNQPFVQFPFIGGSAGTFGFDLSNQGNINSGGAFRAAYTFAFGFPLGVTATLGPAGAGGAANLFPGIGSVYGGILPGIVLQTATIGPAGNQGIGAITVPTVFTTLPSYLPDAPLLNRTFGESSFSTFTVGGKWRLTSNSNPIGAGIIAFYRFYADGVNDFAGFNQLQRGASPGGNKGDVGVIGFADARMRKWLNVSANFGYIYNSDIADGNVTYLDRPDELISAIGVDFPVNKHFQPIVEFRSLQYVGGRTPNAFENSPLDAIAGVRVFARRWVGFSAAYRYHANAQDRASLVDSNFNGNITIGADPRLQAGAGPIQTIPPVTTSFNGVPPGFRTSSDPHGFIFQGFIGRRNSRAIEKKNIPANVTAVNLSQSTISLGCKAGFKSQSGGCKDDKTVNVRTAASDQENDPLTYNYTVSGGRIVGQGANVSWDLSGVGPGTYTITAGVDDGCGVCGESKTATVTVQECPDCVKDCDCPSSITVADPPVGVAPGETLTFTASVVGGSQDSPTYNWSVDKGSIVSGQGTSTITVSTNGLEDTTVSASVDIGGLCDSCQNNATGSGIVNAVPKPVMKDEFGKMTHDDVKARLDPYASDLQADPNARAYIINYGSARNVAKREKLIRNYLVNDRGIDASRLTFVKGGVESVIRTRLWIVPAGADPSTVN